MHDLLMGSHYNLITPSFLIEGQTEPILDRLLPGEEVEAVQVLRAIQMGM